MNFVSLGCLAMGIGLIILRVGEWWPGVSALRKDTLGQAAGLLPFAFAFCFGTLAVLSAGGLLGAVTDFMVWGGGWLGDAALIWGVGGQRENVGREGAEQALTNGGHVMLLILCFVVVVVRKKSASLRREMNYGIPAGVLLGLSKGVAGALAVPLASAVNFFGAWISTSVIQ